MVRLKPGHTYDYVRPAKRVLAAIIATRHVTASVLATSNTDN